MRTYKNTYNGFRLETHKRKTGSWVTYVFSSNKPKAISEHVSYLKRYSIQLAQTTIFHNDYNEYGSSVINKEA